MITATTATSTGLVMRLRSVRPCGATSVSAMIMLVEPASRKIAMPLFCNVRTAAAMVRFFCRRKVTRMPKPVSSRLADTAPPQFARLLQFHQVAPDDFARDSKFCGDPINRKRTIGRQSITDPAIPLECPL